MGQDTSVQHLTYENYVERIPSNTFETVGKNFVGGAAFGTLLNWSVQVGSYAGTFFAVSSLVHSLTTPIFQELVGDRSKYDDLTLSLIDTGRVFVDLTVTFALLNPVNDIVINMLIATLFGAYKKLILDNDAKRHENGLFGNQDRNPCIFNFADYFYRPVKV